MRALDTHQHHGLLVQIHQLALKVRILLAVQLRLDLQKFVPIGLLILFLVVPSIIWILRVDDELFKSKEHLHLLLVHFGLNYVLEQNQAIQRGSKPATS